MPVPATAMEGQCIGQVLHFTGVKPFLGKVKEQRNAMEKPFSIPDGTTSGMEGRSITLETAITGL